MDVKKRLIEMADGTVVESDVLRIAEKIQEYDENLILKYCAQPDSLTDAPYRLVEICRDGLERTVFDIWELDDRVLERLYAADTKHRDIQAMIEGENEKARKDQNRRYQELKDETDNIIGAVLKSDKQSYTFDNPITGNRVKVHQDRPAETVDK
jgi:hypothetical protein